MALSASSLGSALKTVFVANGAADNAATTALCNGLATAIIDHFKNNAEILPTTGTPPMTVVVAGAPTPVAGKGTIT